MANETVSNATLKRKTKNITKMKNSFCLLITFMAILHTIAMLFRSIVACNTDTTYDEHQKGAVIMLVRFEQCRGTLSFKKKQKYLHTNYLIFKKTTTLTVYRRININCL